MKLKDFKGGLFSGKKPQALTPTEASVSKSIQEFLDAHRIYNDRLNAGMIQQVTAYTDKSGTNKEYRRWIHLCKKGTPDRFFIMSGRIYFVEVKRRGKSATDDQLRRHDELQRAGAKIIVTDSIDSFIRQFSELIKVTN